MHTCTCFCNSLHCNLKKISNILSSHQIWDCFLTKATNIPFSKQNSNRHLLNRNTAKLHLIVFFFPSLTYENARKTCYFIAWNFIFKLDRRGHSSYVRTKEKATKIHCPVTHCTHTHCTHTYLLGTVNQQCVHLQKTGFHLGAWMQKEA